MDPSLEHAEPIWREPLRTRSAFILRVCLLFVVLPLVTQCALPPQWLPEPARSEPLSLQTVHLETPAAIAPDIQLSTPEAIAPETQVAMLAERDLNAGNPSSTPALNIEASTTATAAPSSTVTSTSTHTETLTPTTSPTASFTPVTVWPTWTSAPTSTRTPSPVPTSTKTSAPSTQPPPSSTATASNTADPGADPPATSTPTNTPDSSECNPDGNSSHEATLIGLINEARQAEGLHPLVAQSQLTAAARAHSDDMACNDFISHTGSNGSRPADRITAQGYSYSWVGENIFAGSSSPQTSFEWWMNSEPHRDNILHSYYTEVGIGYSYLAGSRYGNHYTAVFARPR